MPFNPTETAFLRTLLQAVAKAAERITLKRKEVPSVVPHTAILALKRLTWTTREFKAGSREGHVIAAKF